MEVADTKTPSSAAWLGGLGALPFIGLAVAIPILTGATRIFVSHALVAYGATILSFLGAVHWGLAMGASRDPDQPDPTPSSLDRGKLSGRLTLSVIPALVGWTALLVSPTRGMIILAVAVAAMLWVDIRATRLGQTPEWYPKLRIPLTCVVVAALLFGAFA